MQFNAIPAPTCNWWCSLATPISPIPICHYTNFLHYTTTFCSVLRESCTVSIFRLRSRNQLPQKFSVQCTAATNSVWLSAVCTLHSFAMVLYKIFKIIIIISAEFKVYCFSFQCRSWRFFLGAAFSLSRFSSLFTFVLYTTCYYYYNFFFLFFFAISALPFSIPRHAHSRTRTQIPSFLRPAFRRSLSLHAVLWFILFCFCT